MKPFRVSIIESVHTQEALDTDNIKHILSEAGMIVDKLTYEDNPYAALNQFVPELILMVPCTPHDNMRALIQDLRHHRAYFNVPLILLTPPDIINEFSFFNLEGDGFIISPLQNPDFISIISGRIMRARHLASQMIHDSLTGLLNHVRLLEQLEIEIARAKRDETCLSFVMIDIDHFKNINDDYGHLIGDAVIKKLALLLKKRLRKSDSVGRYGGDEFAIILPKSKALMAHPMIAQIKNSFSEYRYDTNTPPFKVTLSAGIAELSEHFSSATQLIQAADDALYQAKHQGRNQIVITP